MIGAILGGLTCQFLGRKRSLCIDNLLMAAVFVGISLSPNFIGLMLCRFISGMSCASMMANIPAYTSEICQPEVRKITGNFIMVSYSSGYGLLVILGALLPWRTVIQIVAIFPLSAFILTFWFCPESPIWYMINNREEEARKSLMALRGNECLVDDELRRIKNNLEEERKDREVNKDVTKWYAGLKEITEVLLDGSFLRPFTVVLVMHGIGFEWAGLPQIGFYMVLLLQEANIPFDPYWGAAILCCYRAVALVLASGIIKYCKRRPLYLITSFFVILSNVAMGTYFLFRDEDRFATIPLVKWTPMLSIVVIYTAFAVGYGSVPYMLQGEILPSNSRAIGCGLIGFLDNISLFIATKMAPTISDFIGTSGAFYLYASCAMFSSLVAFFMMPETFGLSLNEIENMYKDKKQERRKPTVGRSRSSNSIMSLYDTSSIYGHRA